MYIFKYIIFKLIMKNLKNNNTSLNPSNLYPKCTTTVKVLPLNSENH